jgi:hypothetical protein
MRARGDSLRIALERALSPLLPANGCATLKEAERAVDAVVDEPLAEAKRSLARQLVARHQAEVQRQAAEAERERLNREREKRTVADAKKIWKALYGRAVAERLEPFAR